MSTNFQTPILFLIFNRPDTTERVFEEIRRIRPAKLYVVADGARPHKENENDLCAATRAIIERVDWECDVIRNYSDTNLGCKARVSSGISWFFENEERGIILEDDCLPDPTFFRFCEELLERYKDDERIGMISGDNFQFGQVSNEHSYYFSRYSHIWGWATWRRAWQKYDVRLSSWPTVKSQKRLRNVFGNARDSLYWSMIFEDAYRGKIDTWDYQWSYACFMNGYLSAMPSVNLISNIGFGQAGSTHTKRHGKFANMETSPLSFPLNHPPTIERSTKSDTIVRRDNYPFFRYLVSKIVKRIKS